VAAVDDFCYQLQGKKGAPLDLAPIAASAYDLCIVDFARDGVDEFGSAEIAALRSPAEPGRIRLAYLSIGEAEKYRFYWPALDKDLLAGANPQWKGNFNSALKN
jgi:cysteinyl-tRNA synthetase